MRFPRTLALLVMLLAGAIALVWMRRTPDGVHLDAKPAVPRASAVATKSHPATADLPADAQTQAKLAVAERTATLARLAYAQAWDDAALSGAMGAFRAWTERYRDAPAAGRAALVAEGVALAKERRAEMLDLIASDPQRALAVTVPAVVRRDLPAEVLAQLETRLAGRGEVSLVAAVPAAGEPAPVAMRRRAVLGGATYTAHVYGRREPQTAKEGVSLHGIALDRRLALHESPVRVLEPGEVPAGAVAADNCPVSDLPVPPLAAGAGVNTAALNVAEAEGRAMEFCDSAPGMIETYAQRLEALEDSSGPRLGDTPARAAEATTPWTIGTKQVIVIRVDFADFPGEPMSQAAALAVMNTGVRPLFEDMSYGKTSIAATISEKVYRMPQTGSAYALADNEGQMHTDARTAAGADYTLSSFDRIVVLFPNLGTSRVPGSLITFGGEAQINAPNIWINGSGAFNTATVSHELGHTYGLLHSNLWRINDGNPVSASGNTLEYGDPFDTMGSASVTGVTRDARHHFNHWHKNRLGWLPDSAVTTVKASGTYRIYRFDSRDVPLTQPLALRIFRDGVRWYWVGLRQNFSSGTLVANGAHIIWGFNNRQQSQLLDLTTPGLGANDATLALGATFSDPVSGVSMKALARGGADPAQFLDVEVTIPATPPRVVASWGREGATFFNGNTGAPTSPVPETNVPLLLSGVQAIAAGEQHAIALKADGSVVAWGNNTSSQTTVPAGLANVISVAAGGDVSGVVKGDGSVQLWGAAAANVIITPPAGLDGVRQLAIGGARSVGTYHALALKTDGTVVAWGSNGSNQTNVPAGLSGVVAVAASERLSVALKADGTVVRWGTTFTGAVPFPAGLNNVAAIATSGGSIHALALKTDRTVVAWGGNDLGQATVPTDLNDVVALATARNFSLALKSDGSVVAWGSTTSSARNVPPSLPRGFALAASSQAGFALIGSSLSFVSQPQDQTVAANGEAVFRAAATGIGAVTYQWRKDGVDIGGATSSTLTLASITTAQAGSYDVMVTDVVGSAISAAGRLTVSAVVTQEVSRIANLSIRTRGGTGAQTLIVGFVIGGPGTSGTKPLLVRGVGPTLSVFGVTGVLPDPKVELYSAAAVKLFENDNWLATDAATFASVGAFALPANSRDAALYHGALSSTSYSAQLTGIGGATGVVLAELYDVTPGATFGAATPRLINVSARALSGTGADVLIAGFVVAGPGEKKVLIRAIGPTLTVFGVTGVLADPKLELFNSATAKIQENDNWGGAAALSAAFTSVGAFGLDGASRDAALLATLPPGSYTAQVSGVGGGTGVALVEVYDVP